MPLFKNGLETALAEVKKYREARARLETREQKAREELERLHADLPALALADILGEGPGGRELGGSQFPGTTPSYGRSTALNLELSTCQDARPELLRKLDAALHSLQTAKADEVRKTADSLRKSLAAHRAKALELQSALQILEECPWAPEVRQVQTDDGQRGWQYAISKSTRLQQQLDAMLADADAIASKPVNVGGGVNGATLEEILQAVEQAPEDTIAPSSRAVEAWYREARAQADAEWNGTGRRHGDPEPPAAELSSLEDYRTLQVSLVWLKDGVIDAQNSSVRYSNRFTIPRELAAERFGAEYPHALVED